MNAKLIKLAASGLLLGGTMTGIATVANSTSVAEVSNRDARDASRAADEAREALAEGRADRAVDQAERAVEKMPMSAEYRHLLGRAYLAAGRFESAETSFQDALTINPDLDRTAFNLALTLIAQGDTQSAVEEIADLQGRIGESDRGLALALAGRHDQAIEILRDAARANGGDPRARQNLALTYALAGRWAEARITAAQDISMGELDGRMREWISLAEPGNNAGRVAYLLGVEADARDPGQPTRLALGPIQNQVMMAEAPADEGEPAVPAPVVAFTAPVEPADVSITPRVTEVEVPPPAPFAAPVETAVAPAPAPVRTTTGQTAEPRVAGSFASRTEGEFIVEEEAPVRMASVTPPPAPRAAPSPAPRPAPAPRVERAPEASSVPAAPRNMTGRFVVQLGAFANQANVTIAWDRAVRRYSALASFVPSRATFEQGRVLHRLSFGGYENHGEAARMCRTLRSNGVECFVRARAGDAPLQMAARSGAGAAALR